MLEFASCLIPYAERRIAVCVSLLHPAQPCAVAGMSSMRLLSHVR